VLFAVAAVRARELDLVGKRLVLVVAHLERRFAWGTLAAEVAVVVGRDRDRHLEAVLGVADVADAIGLGQVLPVAHEVQSSTRP
jgi:hypothetical protein